MERSLRNSNSRILPENSDLHEHDQPRMGSCPLAQSTARSTSLLQDVVAESTSHGQRQTRSGSAGCTYFHEFRSLPYQQLNAAWCCGFTQTSEDVLVPSERLENASLGVSALRCNGISDDRNRRGWDEQLDSSFTKSLELVRVLPSNPTSKNQLTDASVSGNIEQSPLELYNHYAPSQHEDPAQALAEGFRLSCSRVGSCHLGNSGSPSFSRDPCWEQWASLGRDDLALVAKAIESKLRPNLDLDCNRDCNMSGLTDGESVSNTRGVQSLSSLPSVVAGSNVLAPDVHAIDSQSHAHTTCRDVTQLQRPRDEAMQAVFDRLGGGSSLLRTGLDQNVTSHIEQKSESRTGVAAKATSMRIMRRGSKLRSTKRRRSRESHDSEIDHQRMTHIVVERNRRKQMNQHLAALKALMPVSYIYKSDQASIVGAAIEFVRELEVLQDSLQSTLKRRTYAHALDQSRVLPIELSASSSSQPLCPAEDCYVQHRNSFSPLPKAPLGFDQLGSHGHCMELEHLVHAFVPDLKAESISPAATIEMKTVGNNAILNIMTPWRAEQLVQVILAIESLFLDILHANITTYEDIVLYTFNVQMQSNSEMSVDQIVAALQKTFNLLHYLQT